MLTSPKFSVKSLRESLTLEKLTIFYQIYIFCSILEQQHSKFAQRSNCTAQRAPWFDEFFNPLSIQLKSNALKNGTLTLQITELLLLFFFELTIFSAFFSTAGELKSPLIYFCFFKKRNFNKFGLFWHFNTSKFWYFLYNF